MRLFVLLVLFVPGSLPARAADRPMIWTEGDFLIGELATMNVENPSSQLGVMLIFTGERLIVRPLPPVPHISIAAIVPPVPGARFTCQYFTYSQQGIQSSNLLPVLIDNRADPSDFALAVTARPMALADETGGQAGPALVQVPIYLAEHDNINVNYLNLANLHATMVDEAAPRILAQQFSVTQVYNREDQETRLARVAQGYLVLDHVRGDLREPYRIWIEGVDGFPGSDEALAERQDGAIIVDTGAARFTLRADQAGFKVEQVEVGGAPMLAPAGGLLSMQRRDVMSGEGARRLVSTAGTASAEIVKNGAAAAEVLVRGEMRPEDGNGGVPQRYLLLLSFHKASGLMRGELMLTNWAARVDDQPANLTIPYDGFGLELNLVKTEQAAVSARVLLDEDQAAFYEPGTWENLNVTLGYAEPRHYDEYMGIGDGHFWPENERLEGETFRTPGFRVLRDHEPDGRFVEHFDKVDRYPRGCVMRLDWDGAAIGAMSGSRARYDQPVGLRARARRLVLKLEVRLSDPLAPNGPAKSIPFRSSLRKEFAVDFSFDRGQTLGNFARVRQSPYYGIYSNIANYSGRSFEFQFLPTSERNDIWRRLGFMRQDDDWEYSDLTTESFKHPYYIGRNRTGGYHNWDQAFIDFCTALRGRMGYLVALRSEVSFHSTLGKAQFEDDDLDLEVANPNISTTSDWSIDIEHEDHKGFHAGVTFFGNPLDIISLSRMAYATKGQETMGGYVWVRAAGNMIGRIFEEQGVLRSLWPPQVIPGHGQPIEDEILDAGLTYVEDIFSRRIDPENPCDSGGWTTDAGTLPTFDGDPKYYDYPTAKEGTPMRYPWISRTGWFKVLASFHMMKGLSSAREFMPDPVEFPEVYRTRVAALMDEAALRLAQGGMTLAQWYSFLPICHNFEPECGNYTELAPWERFLRQRKYYYACMWSCDDRFADERNNWMGYDFMDAYAEAALQYLNRGQRDGAFYMLRAALNHLATERWQFAPDVPCGEARDDKATDFFGNARYPGTMKLLKVIRDAGLLYLFENPYPDYFPMALEYGE